MDKNDASVRIETLAARTKGFGVAVDVDDLSGDMTSKIRTTRLPFNSICMFDLEKLSMTQLESPDCFGIETEAGARPIGYCDHAVANFHGFVKQR
jgi:hypothetical protein